MLQRAKHKFGKDDRIDEGDNRGRDGLAEVFSQAGCSNLRKTFREGQETGEEYECPCAVNIPDAGGNYPCGL